MGLGSEACRWVWRSEIEIMKGSKCETCGRKSKRAKIDERMREKTMREANLERADGRRLAAARRCRGSEQRGLNQTEKFENEEVHCSSFSRKSVDILQGISGIRLTPGAAGKNSQPPRRRRDTEQRHGRQTELKGACFVLSIVLQSSLRAPMGRTHMLFVVEIKELMWASFALHAVDFLISLLLLIRLYYSTRLACFLPPLFQICR